LKRRALTSALLLAGLLAGCDEARKVCDPGQRASCTCAGAASGEMTCLSDGSGWRPCQCCYPSCFRRMCGDDGCGGSCGTCAASEFCNFRGRCECVPDCTGKDCGSDGCVGSCGDCLDCFGEPAPWLCQPGSGQCQEQCCPDCLGRACGPDPVCGTSCGTCAAPTTCGAQGLCECVPDCAGKTCGPDGCNGSCGECLDCLGNAHPILCDEGTCLEACCPVCGLQECGLDPVCGASCGTCLPPEACTAQGLCEVPAACPDLSGTYDITPYCLGGDIGDIVIDQTGCAIAFTLDAIYCTGRLDAQLNLYVECGGLGFPCYGEVSLTTSFVIVCSPQCSFIFERLELGAACTSHRDPVCTAEGELCGVVLDDGGLATRCVRILPGGREPGAYCDEEAGLLCANSLCVDHACGAVCVDDLDCAGYLGTSCQDVPYTLEGVTGSIRSCTPVNAGETACRRTPDCAPSRVCSFRPTLDDVLAVCLQPNPDGAPAGLACTQGSECETGLCLCGAELCTGGNEGRCSELCLDSLDCVQGSECGLVMVQDLGGGAHELTACVRDPDPDACGRNADCPAGRSCQVFLDADGLSLVTECQYGSGPGHDNTGEACAGPTDCFSVWCGNWGYCLGVCVSDADCPTFDTATACGADATCELGTLCEAGLCRRVFGCTTYAFYLGDDASGQPVYDTTNLCMPERRPCALDADCRAGEACRLDANSTATAAVYVCDAGGPGTGQLGANCEAGEEVCWSGHCLIEGEGGPGLEYCTRACVTDADCEPTDTYSCQAIRVDVRPGFVSYLPACARR